jgi:carbonic anhydrase
MSFGNTKSGQQWAYSTSSTWKKQYPAAGGKQQSPINIDMSAVVDCDMLCKIALKMAPSTCRVRIANRTPIIQFDPGCYIKFIRTQDILSLKSGTIHVPSMHTVNGQKYDMELVLLFKQGGGINPESDGYMPGGAAVSILFQRGQDYGSCNNFFNEFVHKLPNDQESAREMDIPVSPDWSPDWVLPQESKSYFYYPGSLPYPPCEEGWRWIVFEDIQGISGNIIDSLSVAFSNNIRPLKALNSRAVAYNSNPKLPVDRDLVERSAADRAKIEEISAAADETNTDDTRRAETERLGVIAAEKQRVGDWYRDNKLYIKGIVITIATLLTVYAALKLVKYIVSNDLLNKFIVAQVLGATVATTAASNNSTSANTASNNSPSASSNNTN